VTRPRWGDGARLAFGTLTVLPVPPPRTVDRSAGAAAMLLAPLVGLAVAVPAAVMLAAGERLGLAPLLTSALTITALAALTRGLHLDGLADTADGLGSGKPAPAALEVMRRGDVGPFGVVALVLTLLVQVTALGQLAATGRGTTAVVVAVMVAVVTSRLVLPLACSERVPAARPDGLGATVAASVGAGPMLTVLLTTYAVLLGVLWGAVLLGVATALAPAVGLAAAGLLLRRCACRLGGVTGDVLGALVEVAVTTTLVVLCLA
jgi:adenosylcobinamide-GDP ribazoletransferase